MDMRSLVSRSPAASMARTALAAAAVALAWIAAPAGPARADEFQTLLDRFIEKEGLPGGVLLVSSPQRRSVAVAGLADRRAGRPVTEDTRFYAASVGKVPVAIAALQLVEEGRLDLDAPVASLAAGLPGIAKLPNARAARLRHLLEHSSGIPDYLTDEFAEASAAEPARRWTAAEAIAFAFDQEAEGRPGTLYSYSNTNYVLLGHIIAAADGAPLEAVLRRRVFEPAGMTGTTVGARPGDRRLARGYQDAEDDGRLRDVSAVSWNSLLGDGPIVTTAGDLERFLLALFRDGRLLRPATLARMATPSAKEAGYGFGLELGETRWGRWAGHTGSYDGFDAEARYYLDRETVIVFMANGNQDSDRSIIDEAAGRLFGRARAAN